MVTQSIFCVSACLLSSAFFCNWHPSSEDKIPSCSGVVRRQCQAYNTSPPQRVASEKGGDFLSPLEFYQFLERILIGPTCAYDCDWQLYPICVVQKEQFLHPKCEEVCNDRGPQAGLLLIHSSIQKY